MRSLIITQQGDSIKEDKMGQNQASMGRREMHTKRQSEIMNKINWEIWVQNPN
jgi:hypothetical protein